MTVRVSFTNHFDHGGGGGGPAGSWGPALRAATSGDGGGELSVPSNCTMQAMSTGDRAFFLFLALVILGEMMAGLLLDAVAVA